jgi:hypothetical protein
MSTASNIIQSIISIAKAEATGTVGAAKQLVAEAVAVIDAYKPRYPEKDVKIDPIGISDGSGGFVATEKPPNFPGIRDLHFPPDPDLRDLDDISATFTTEAPTLVFPKFDYAIPAAIPPFIERAPDIDSSITLPDKPTLTWPDRPQLVALDTTLTVPDLVVPTFDAHRPTYQNIFNEDWRRDFSDAESMLPRLEAYAPVLMEQFFPGVRAAYTALVERINGILEGQTTALTDAFDQHLYDQLRARVEAERDAALRQANDAADATGWGLPGRVRQTALARVEADAAKSRSNAALEVYTKRAERELQHLQFVMELAGKLHGAATQFVLQASELQLTAFKTAIAFADAATQFALKVYEQKQKDYEIDVRIMESEINLFQARLKAEMAQGDVVRLRLEIEKQKSELNRDLIAQYTAELQANETQAKVYAEEVNAIEAELKARRYPLDLFEAKIRSFVALADAKKVEYQLVEAQIGADKAKLDGEMARAKLFESEASVFKTRIEAQTARITAQARRNEQVLDEYKTKVDTQLKLAQVDEAVAKHALNTYKAMADVYVAESQQDLAKAKFLHEKVIEQARLDKDVLDMDYQRQFHNITLELGRVKALADMQMSSAKVHGDMANSALGSLNNVVTLAQTEAL